MSHAVHSRAKQWTQTKYRLHHWRKKENSSQIIYQILLNLEKEMLSKIHYYCNDEKETFLTEKFLVIILL